MTRSLLITFAVLALVAPIELMGRPGGGGGGRGRPGGPGRGWNPGAFQQWRDMWQKMREEQQKYDEKQKEEETRRKIEKTLADGWKALKAHDTAAALDAFMDVLDFQPTHADAKLGLGLARAQKGQYTMAQDELAAAGRLKADPRLVAYNTAIAYARISQKPRAMVAINKLLVETKGVDELLLNAQRTLYASLDEKTRTTLPAMPGMVKIMDAATLSLKSARNPLERWGVSWMAAEDVAQRKAAGEKEPMPREPPFLMPSNVPLPEKGQKYAVNPIAPIIQGAVAIASNTGNPEVIATPEKPVAVATNTPPKAGGLFALGGSSNGGAKSGDVFKPATPAAENTKPVETIAPVNPEPAVPAVTRRSARTLRGAAFAVAPDMLITCERLVSGSSSIQVQTIDGKGFDATVISADETSGVALLRVEGAKFSPVALAETAKSGAVNIAAFVRPAVFSPNLDIVRGELYSNAGKFLARATSHPRSAGSPLMDDQGKVLGMVVATRDDPAGQLPVIPAEVLRRFATGKFTSVTETTANDPSECVVEMTVTRQD